MAVSASAASRIVVFWAVGLSLLLATLRFWFEGLVDRLGVFELLLFAGWLVVCLGGAIYIAGRNK